MLRPWNNPRPSGFLFTNTGFGQSWSSINDIKFLMQGYISWSLRKHTTIYTVKITWMFIFRPKVSSEHFLLKVLHQIVVIFVVVDFYIVLPCTFTSFTGLRNQCILLCVSNEIQVSSRVHTHFQRDTIRK